MLAQSPYGFDLWRWLRDGQHDLLTFRPLAARVNFLPMADQAVYSVRLGPAGLEAEPVNTAAQKIVTEPYLKDLLAAYNKAPYVSQYLDTLYGQNVGNALNVAVVNLLAGKGSVPDIITSVNQAAAKG